MRQQVVLQRLKTVAGKEKSAKAEQSLESKLPEGATYQPNYLGL